MEDGSGWTPNDRKKLRWSDVIRQYMKEYRSTEIRSTKSEAVEIENSMCRPQIGKWQKKKR